MLSNYLGDDISRHINVPSIRTKGGCEKGELFSVRHRGCGCKRQFERLVSLEDGPWQPAFIYPQATMGRPVYYNLHLRVSKQNLTNYRHRHFSNISEGLRTSSQMQSSSTYVTSVSREQTTLRWQRMRSRLLAYEDKDSGIMVDMRGFWESARVLGHVWLLLAHW